MTSTGATTARRSRGRITVIASACAVGLAVLAQPASAACHIAAFSPGDYQVDEGAGEVTVTVTLLGGQPGCEGTVRFETSDGTATAPGDYASSSGELRFVANDDRSETIVVPIADDEDAEETETFTVVLSGGTGSISADDAATVTITDDDAAPASPTPTETPDDTPTPDDGAPTPDDTPVGGAGDDGGSNGVLIGILAALAALAVVGSAILARRRRGIA